MSKRITEEVCLKFFQKMPDADGKGLWKCQCGKILKRQEGSGWTNLRMHIISQHPDASKQFEENPENGQSTLLDPSLGLINKKAQNVFAWLDWVCNDLMPFSFVDLPRTRKYSNLNPNCRNTLTKYLNLVTLEVENALKDQLPDKFAIAFDGWTTGSTHYVGIMATVPKESSYETMLLAFTPLIDETCLNSAEHCRLIEETLELYGKDLDNVVAFICDNCELNKSICDTLNKPMIGCASHRFSIAVSDYVADKLDIINKVQALMIKLRTLKFSAKLRQHTHLKPVIYCVTRWSSMADMLNRYIDIKPVLVEHFSDDNNILLYLMSSFLKMRKSTSLLST